MPPLTTTTTTTTTATASTTSTRAVGFVVTPEKECERANGMEETLRGELQEAQQRDATSKAALAKSDSVILELRGSVRQLKRQLEILGREKESSAIQAAKLSRELDQLKLSAEHTLHREREVHQYQIQQLQAQLTLTSTQAREHVVGELQVQLDRAHAQILTADMVRKELEDTLEAEQYTWELRVQDQERQLQHLQQDCTTAQNDLQQCRSQWKEAETGWNQEVQELKKQIEAAHSDLLASRALNGNASNELQRKIDTMEKERRELQSCLDEALKELEAVDDDLRNHEGSVEPLQHLYRWLLERNDHDDRHNIPSDIPTLLESIQELVEANNSNNNNNNDFGSDALRVAELEAQISVYRGDLKAKEESSSELRAALKEAVALLKPLQDAAAKAEKEKAELERELESARSQTSTDRDEEIQKLKEEIRILEGQSPPRSPGSPGNKQTHHQSSSEEGHEKQKETARAKRDAELALKKMLSKAQSRFQQLHQVNHDIARENEELHQKLEETEKELSSAQKVEDDDDDDEETKATEMREAAIQQLQDEIKDFTDKLDHKEKELAVVQEELNRAREAAPSLVADFKRMETEVKDLKSQVKEKQRLEADLVSVNEQLKEKIESERVLNESLVEALNLLKPLQSYLQAAEKEKRDLARQLKSSRKRLAKLENASKSQSSIKSPPPPLSASSSKSESDHDDKSKSQQAANDRLQAQLVELQSRYEVTMEKFKSADIENQALVEALKHREQAEKEMAEELNILRTRLQSSERELENAKYIATSALMKVEELTSSSTKPRKGQQQEMQVLRAQVQALQHEVDTTKELNESLEHSMRERDEILKELRGKVEQQNNTEMEIKSPPRYFRGRRLR